METRVIARTKDLNLYYGAFHALKDVNLAIGEKRITAIIGPSGCGKSTLLRVFNRMNDLVEGAKVTGKVELDGQDIHKPGTDLLKLRKKVGMVFQRPNPFPLTVFENIVFGLRLHHLYTKDRAALRAVAEEALRSTDWRRTSRLSSSSASASRGSSS
jgi:phosphate transport system ATP-binding protein